MRKIIFLVSIIFISFVFVGCGKKETDNLDSLLKTTGIIVDVNTGIETNTGLSQDSFDIEELNIENKHGKYELYTKYLDKKYENSGYNVILNFHDPKNTTCNMFKNNVNKNLNKIPSKTIIIEVDINKYKNLVKKYNIKKANMFVYLDKDGKEKDRRGLGITELEELFE